MKHHSILFYPLHATSFEKFFLIAGALKAKSFSPVFLITNPQLQPALPRLEDAGFEWHGLGDVNQSIPKTPPATRVADGDTAQSMAENKARRRTINLPAPLRRLKQTLFDLRQQRALDHQLLSMETELSRLLDQLDIGAAIVCGDRHGQYERPLVKLCSERSIPLVMPPVSVFAAPDVQATQRLEQAALHSVEASSAFARRWPEQCRETGQGMASYYPRWMVPVLEHRGHLSRYPWLSGGSGKIVVMQSGELAHQRYIQFGGDPNTSVVTGDPEYDDILNSREQSGAIRESLASEYGFDTGKKWIAVSLPQLMEHNLLPPEQHWQVIHHICKTATSCNANVAVSLHPKMKPQNYSRLESEYNLKIIDQPMRRWIGVGDVLLCCVGSSTELWGILTRQPVLVLNWFGLVDEHYADDAGYIDIQKSEDLSPGLELTLGETPERRQMMERNDHLADRICPSGSSLKRVIDFIIEQAKSK